MSGRFYLLPTVLFTGDCYIALSGNFFFVPDWICLFLNSGLYIYIFSVLCRFSFFTIFIFFFPVSWSKISILLLFAGFFKSDKFYYIYIFLYILISSVVFFNQILLFFIRICIVPDRDFLFSRYLLFFLK